MNEPVSEQTGQTESAPARRVRTGWIVVGVLATGLVTLVSLIGVLRWFQREASWPPELDDPPTAALFSNVEQPTADDLVLLDELVTELAASDPIVAGLLDGRPWPEPGIVPVTWIGANGRSVLIGGSFNLDLGGSDYQGPWPTTGCSRGRYRGTVRTVEAYGLERVAVIFDLTFERVTQLTIAPGQPGSTSIVYHDDAESAPWYTGRCPLFNFPD